MAPPAPRSGEIPQLRDDGSEEMGLDEVSRTARTERMAPRLDALGTSFRSEPDGSAEGERGPSKTCSGSEVLGDKL